MNILDEENDTIYQFDCLCNGGACLGPLPFDGGDRQQIIDYVRKTKGTVMTVRNRAILLLDGNDYWIEWWRDRGGTMVTMTGTGVNIGTVAPLYDEDEICLMAAQLILDYLSHPRAAALPHRIGVEVGDQPYTVEWGLNQDGTTTILVMGDGARMGRTELISVADIDGIRKLAIEMIETRDSLKR